MNRFKTGNQKTERSCKTIQGGLNRIK